MSDIHALIWQFGLVRALYWARMALVFDEPDVSEKLKTELMDFVSRHRQGAEVGR